MNDFGKIYMKFGNEFWLILFREYISPKLFAVHKLESSQIRVFTLIFLFYKMLFTNRLEFSFFADFFVKIFKTREKYGDCE
jgi:hypothetical protein